MKIEEIDINSPLYKKTLDLRTNVISIPFGFPLPQKENETPNSRMFIAIDNGDIIGFAMITPAPDETSIRARQIAVTPSRQKQGIGRQLISQAETTAKALGYDELLLFAHTGSYQFFLKLGYIIKGDWQTGTNGLKTVLMGKKL